MSRLNGTDLLVEHALQRYAFKPPALALGVCAGSSLFTTAATSGPLAQALTERADLRDDQGNPLRFGFMEFLPVGIISFLTIEAVAIGYCLLTM